MKKRIAFLISLGITAMFLGLAPSAYGQHMTCPDGSTSKTTSRWDIGFNCLTFETCDGYGGNYCTLECSPATYLHCNWSGGIFYGPPNCHCDHPNGCNNVSMQHCSDAGMYTDSDCLCIPISCDPYYEYLCEAYGGAMGEDCNCEIGDAGGGGSCETSSATFCALQKGTWDEQNCRCTGLCLTKSFFWLKPKPNQGCCCNQSNNYWVNQSGGGMCTETLII